MILRMAALNCNFNPHLPCGRWRLLYRYSFLLRNFNPHLPCGRWQKTLSDNDLSDYFNPHLPCGRWRCHSFLFHALRNFNPHLPCGRWPRSLAHHIPSQHFNPHLPCRRWRCLVAVDMIVKVFQSTPSLQKVTQGKRNKTAIAKFQSTPSLQKVTATYFACIKRLSISIHTFLAEGDSSRLQMLFAKMDFNPHLPCGRWPGLCKALFQCLNNFNPHLPCGRWQGCPLQSILVLGNFNPHLPCGRWPSIGLFFQQIFYFNPHLPYGRWRSICPMRRRNGDFNPHLPCRRWQQQQLTMCMIFLFQSTPSLQKVTWIEDSYTVSVTISIHTFLAEGDGSRMSVWRAIPNFNPHLPRGRWRGSRNKAKAVKLFQSTPSSRKVTICEYLHAVKDGISIHTFLAEGDRLPGIDSTGGHISIHTFLAEGDRLCLHDHDSAGQFQSTPSSRKVTASGEIDKHQFCISIHTFLAEGDLKCS